MDKDTFLKSAKEIELTADEVQQVIRDILDTAGLSMVGQVFTTNFSLVKKKVPENKE